MNPSLVLRSRMSLSIGPGRHCTLVQPRLPGLTDYYVLSVAENMGPLSSTELDALSTLAQRVGRELALERHGDPECYSIIYNAGRTRRKPWPHFHILLAASTFEKRRAFVLLQLKHVLRWCQRLRAQSFGRFA
jgi:hypothetical protein